MGFWVMILSAIFGIILLVQGFSKRIDERVGFSKLFLIVLGFLLVAFAIFLGWPH